MSYTRADARAELRQQLNDRIDTADVTVNPPSHLHRRELSTPANGAINGGNHYLVKHYPMLSKVDGDDLETLIQAVDELNASYIVDPFSTDYLRGDVFLDPPPNGVQAVFISYFSQWYLDSELNQALAEAQTFIGVQPVPDDATELNVDFGLRPALLMYAKCVIFEANSTKSADFFDHQAGGKVENKAEVAKQWEDKAAKSKKQAEVLRDDFYTRKGQRNAPAFGVGAPAGTTGYQVNR